MVPVLEIDRRVGIGDEEVVAFSPHLLVEIVVRLDLTEEIQSRAGGWIGRFTQLPVDVKPGS